MAGQCNITRYRIYHAIAFFVSFVVIAVAFIHNSFAVFANATKATFSLTQRQLELLMSITQVGMCSCLPTGIILRGRSTRWAALVALVVSAGAYLLVASATYSSQFYNSNYWLLLIYFLLCGVGSGITYITALTASVKRFPATYNGTIVGILQAGLSFGAIGYVGIYNKYFIGYGLYDESLQNLAGFMFLVAVILGCVNFLGVLFYELPVESKYNDLDNKESQLYTSNIDILEEKSTDVPPVESKSGASKQRAGKWPYQRDRIDSERTKLMVEGSDNHNNHTEPAHEYSGLKMLKYLDFHLIIWSGVILMTFSGLNNFNVTTYLKSFHLEMYALYLPYVAPICGLLCKPSLGALSDFTKQYMSRAWYLIFTSLLAVLSWILSIFFINHISMLLIHLIIVNFAGFGAFALSPVLLLEQFNVQNFAKNWGFMMVGWSIATLIIQDIFGRVYDSQTVVEGGVCYDLDCYTSTFILGAVFTFIAILLLALFIFRQGRRQN